MLFKDLYMVLGLIIDNMEQVLNLGWRMKAIPMSTNKIILEAIGTFCGKSQATGLCGRDNIIKL